MPEIIKRSNTAVTYIAQEDGKTILGEAVDVAGNLDRVKRMREAGINSELMGHCTASIPLAIIGKWGAQFGLSIEEVAADDALLDRCIADYSAFKVRGGYI